MGQAVNLELTEDEALVLFGFLARFDSNEKLTIVDQAEERVLWNLHCLLQKHLVEIIDPNYQALIEAARNRLRDPKE